MFILSVNWTHDLTSVKMGFDKVTWVIMNDDIK